MTYFDKVRIAYQSLENSGNRNRENKPRVHGALALAGLDRPSDSFQGYVTSGMHALMSPLVAFSLDENDVRDYNLGKNIFSHNYRMYNNKPSAVIASNGIKMVKGRKTKKMEKKIEKKVEKKMRKKRFTNGGSGMRFKSLRGFGRRGRGGGAFMSGGGRVVRFGNNHNRVVSQPLVKAVVGSAMKSVMRSKRANCMTVKTKIFLGQLYLDDNGGTGFIINTAQVNGQYYFNPANATYTPPAGNLVNMARMFQNYIIKNVKYAFKASISTGNTSLYTVNVGFFSDPNYGETVIPGFTTITQLSSDDVLNLPNATDFPAWMPNKVVAPPRRFYNNKRFTVRSDELNNWMQTGTSPGQVALNRECYAFGMWIVVDGPTPEPGTSVPIAKVFMELEIDLCDMAPQMLYDATGGVSVSSSVGHISSRPEPKELQQRIEQIVRKERKDSKVDIMRWKDSLEKLNSVHSVEELSDDLHRLKLNEKWVRLDDDQKSESSVRKSTSNKSTK